MQKALRVKDPSSQSALPLRAGLAMEHNANHPWALPPPTRSREQPTPLLCHCYSTSKGWGGGYKCPISISIYTSPELEPAEATALLAFVTHTSVEFFTLFCSLSEIIFLPEERSRGAAFSQQLFCKLQVLKQCLILEKEQRHTNDPSEVHTDKLHHKHTLLHPWSEPARHFWKV